MIPALRNLRGLVLPLSLLGAAEIALLAFQVQSYSVAAPSSAFHALYTEAISGELLKSSGETLSTAFSGLFIGGGIGLVAGLIFGLFRPLGAATNLLVEILRPIPSVALLPIALLVLGLGYWVEVAVVAFAVLWPMLIMTRAAIGSIEPQLMEVARTLQMSGLETVWKIFLPAVLLRVFVAVRIAAGIALIVAVTVEIVANPYGLGHAITIAQQSLKPELMYAYVLWLALLGWGLNQLLVMVERSFFRGMANA